MWLRERIIGECRQLLPLTDRMENTAVSLYAVSWEVVLLFSRHRNINVRTLPLASSVIFCHKTEKRAGICLCQMQSSINPCSMWCVFVKCSALFWPLRKYERLWWVQKQMGGEWIQGSITVDLVRNRLTEASIALSPLNLLIPTYSE